MPLEDVFPVKGKTVLITGAAGWLGRRMAKVFAGCGANLILFSRSKGVIDLAKEIEVVYGVNADPFAVDCHTHAFSQFLMTTRDVDVLINNAWDLTEATGFGRKGPPCYDEWYRAFQCLHWVVQATETIGDRMKGHGGAIINVASMYAMVAPDPKLYEGTAYMNPPTYSAMKAGLLAYTRYCASFMGFAGVRVNALCPGAIPNEDVPHEFRQRLAGRTCLGRVGVPEDLDQALLFLATAPYVTGQAIVVDGGWTVC